MIRYNHHTTQPHVVDRDDVWIDIRLRCSCCQMDSIPVSRHSAILPKIKSSPFCQVHSVLSCNRFYLFLQPNTLLCGAPLWGLRMFDFEYRVWHDDTWWTYCGLRFVMHFVMFHSENARVQTEEENGKLKSDRLCGIWVCFWVQTLRASPLQVREYRHDFRK